MSFNALGLSLPILTALSDLGYTTPTSIQLKAIPGIIQKRDILGIAKTGSGKTASYVLPILEQLESATVFEYREPTVLVLVPTRELAEQVCSVFNTFIPHLKAPRACLAVYGGVSINAQMQAIGRVNVLVATPGRLLDLIEKNAVRLRSVSTLVLDEADKMLSLGFKEEMDRIIGLLPAQRQNLLFSATLNHDLSLIEEGLLHDPLVMKIEDTVDEIDRINQLAYLVKEERKGPLLRYLIKTGNLNQVLVFTASTARADSVMLKLCKNKIEAGVIHSKIGQQGRRQVLHAFKSGQLRVLVATDLLARGIDIEALPCVINYELPRSPKDYVHRIGRTGRMKSFGDAISLITTEDLHHFKIIQKKMKKQVRIVESDAIDLHGY